MCTMNLRFKMFSGFILLIIIPLLLLGTITFVITFNLLEKKYSEQAQFSMRAMSHSIGYIFDEINKVSDTGIANNVFQKALASSNPYEHDMVSSSVVRYDDNGKLYIVDEQGRPISKQLDDTLKGTDYIRMNERQQNFRKLLFNHPAISYAFLYNFSSYARGEGIIPIFSKENFKEMPFDDFKNHPLYKRVMELNGVPLWVGPNEYPELTGSEQVFTQIRVVKDLSTLKPLGISIIQIKNWDLDTFFNKFYTADQMENTKFFIVSQDGRILYDNSKQLTGQIIADYASKPVKFENTYVSYKDKFGERESVITYHPMSDYGWYLISVRDWSSLSKEMVVFLKWVSTILLICILGALLFNLLFTNRITRNITRIVRFMRRVEDGDLNARVVEEGRDELRMLSHGFNSLIERVSGLIDQVKNEQQQKNKAEMRVLEAQIKPHFLFNTLESINVLAIQNEGRKVSQMVYRLGNILRISIQDKEEITIREELEYLKSYLEIQKFRFEELFNFEIEVPENIMHCKVMKLTLQPLVENSIQHGFDGIEHTGWIRITAYEDQDRILIRVEDNGLGMSNEQLRKFQYMLSDEQKSVLPQEVESYNTERRGLGVRSVADRLRIRYGPGYGLFICSTSQMGTMIQCVIPKYEQGDTL